MQEQPRTRGTPVAEDDNALDQAVLGLLLSDEAAAVWAVVDLQREIGDDLATLDSLRRLERSGLAHVVVGQCVFASRAARCSYDLW